MRVMMCCFLLSIGVSSATAGAQSHEGRSIAINTGGGGVFRGEYRSRAGVAADAMFSARVTQGIRWGISASVQSGLENTDECERSTLDGPCLTALPLVVSGNVLLGRVWNFSAQSSWSLRTYAGPSLVRVYQRAALLVPDRWITMGGATGRVEVVKHAATHLDVFATLRASLIPAMPKDARGVHAFGIGIAVH